MSGSTNAPGRKRVGVLGALCTLMIVGAVAALSNRPVEQKQPPDGDIPPGDLKTYRPQNLTFAQVRRFGAVGNLNEGIETKVQGVSARLLAWPGNGFINQSLHVLTLRPGDESRSYTYDLAEEALVCLFGKGEVFLRGEWVGIEAGDVAYCPEGTPHAVRNPKGNAKDFILISQITPPQVDLYLDGGFYDKAHAVFNHDAVTVAQKQARPGTLPRELEVHYNDSHPKLRAWNLTNEEIRRRGALFNLFNGAEFKGIGVPMRIVLFPGFGTRMSGLHCGHLLPGAPSDVHTHPISEDIIVTLSGQGWMYIDGKRVDTDTYDVDMASVLAWHGGGSRGNAGGFVIGFGAPPQLDLYIKTDYYKDGKYTRPDFKRLELKLPGK